MDSSAPTPRSRRKQNLLSGAKAYFGKGKPQDESYHNASMSELDGVKSPADLLTKTHSESALEAPVTPKPDGKKVRRIKRNSSDASTRKLSSRRTMSAADSTISAPQTPRAYQKIRREPTPKGDGRATRSDAESLDDTECAVSPSPKNKKIKRRKSLGAMAGDMDERGRKSVKGKKKERPSSVGSLSRQVSKRRETSSHSKPRQQSLEILMNHLDTPPIPYEGKLREPDDNDHIEKTRTTVDYDGKIHRVKKKSKDDGYPSDDDAKSKQSASSRRSKGSIKSTGSKKGISKKAREKAESKRKLLHSPRPDAITEVIGVSEHSEPSARSRRTLVGNARSERRILVDEASHQIGGLPNFDSPNIAEAGPSSDVAQKSFRSRVSESSTDTRDSARKNLEFGGLPETPSAKADTLEEEVERLNKKIVELHEENLKTQFASQSESAKLRKELREEKLELQRSQTERRELRAELRERDMIIDESDRKIQALEKAVESQLDKVDDLEEELRRANEEIFDLEEKLVDMEKVLTDSSAVETNALGKEKALGDMRQERMERRLEDREKQLEVRAQKLREERDTLTRLGQPQREIDQLEQDNRMLLKALNREKDDVADKLKEKDNEVKKLRQKFKLEQVGSGAVDEGVSQIMKENLDLQEKLDNEEGKTSATLKEKEDTISAMEEELNKLKKGEIATNQAKGTDDLTRDLGTIKAEADAMNSKYEGALRRNQFLEEDIDHWKSVNCNLEDELFDWKSQAANWRAKYEDVVDPSDLNDQGQEPNILSYSMQRDPSAAQLALGRRDDDDDDCKTTASEPANSIANLWSKLTTPNQKRPKLNGLNSESVREVLARSTFH